MADNKPIPLPLASIETHERLQPRGTTSYREVKRYAADMAKGDEFPPVHVGRIGKKLYLIDGHHRFQAAGLARRPTIAATVKNYRTLDDAHRAALQANGSHGKRMSNAEKQHAFDAYISAGLHIHNGDDLGHVAGSLKSLRTIATECPVYGFQQVSKKLKAMGIEVPRDGVKPFRPSASEECEQWDGPSEEDLATEDAIQLAAFREHLAGAASALGYLSDSFRWEAVAELTALARSLNPEAFKPFVPLDI